MIDENLGANIFKIGDLLLQQNDEQWLSLYIKDKKTTEVLMDVSLSSFNHGENSSMYQKHKSVK